MEITLDVGFGRNISYIYIQGFMSMAQRLRGFGCLGLALHITSGGEGADLNVVTRGDGYKGQYVDPLLRSLVRSS